MKKFKIVFLSLLLISLFSNFPSTVSADVTFDSVYTIDSTNDIYPNSTTTDKDGNIYTLGYFYGTVDFDGEGDNSSITSSNNGHSYSLFILKQNSSLNFISVYTLDSTNGISSNSLTTDKDGNIYTAGYFYGTVDFDGEGINSPVTSSNGGNNSSLFILKQDSSLNFTSVYTLDSTNYIYPSSITVNKDGNIYTTGYFRGTVDFDGEGINPSVTSGNEENNTSLFILKQDSSLNFTSVYTLDSTNDIYPNSITTDKDGNIYMTGQFSGTVDFDGEGINPSVASNNDGNDKSLFTLKQDSSLNFTSVYILDLTSYINYSTTIDKDGNIYTTGNFQGTVDFDGEGINSPAISGNSENSYSLFILKQDSSLNFISVYTIDLTYMIYPNSTIADKDGNIYIVGSFYGTVYFDGEGGNSTITSSNGGNNGSLFLLKLSQQEEAPSHTSHTRSSGYASPAMLATFQQEQDARARAVGLPTSTEGCTSITAYSPVTGKQCPSVSNTPINTTRTLKLTTPRMIGDDVKEVQTYLNTHGYTIKTIDGIYGINTSNTVKLFQTKNNLTPDGSVGKMTRERMK